MSRLKLAIEQIVFARKHTIRLLDEAKSHDWFRQPAGGQPRLDKPPLKPLSLAKTKLWSLLWCAQHEMVHAGQIGLLRRLLGYPAIR